MLFPKTGCVLFQYLYLSLYQRSQPANESNNKIIKEIHIEKGKVKQFLFTDNMISYVKDPEYIKNAKTNT